MLHQQQRCRSLEHSDSGCALQPHAAMVATTGSSCSSSHWQCRPSSSRHSPAQRPQQHQRLALLVLLLACCGQHRHSFGAEAVSPPTSDRSGAFIGYAEQEGYGSCADKLPSCERDASFNLCLTDPYRMRRLCPRSCLVEPCVSSGSVLVRVCAVHWHGRGVDCLPTA
jgi:hypothetical protein